MHGNTSTRRHLYVSQMNGSSSIPTEPGFVGISSSLKRTALQRDSYRLEVVASLRLDVRLGVSEEGECFAQFDAFFELPTENHLERRCHEISLPAAGQRLFRYRHHCSPVGGLSCTRISPSGSTKMVEVMTDSLG